MTWRVALLGAGSALVGGVIGVIGSIYVTNADYDHEQTSIRRAETKEAFVKFTAIARQASADLHGLGDMSNVFRIAQIRAKEESDPVGYFTDAAQELKTTEDIRQRIYAGLDEVYLYGTTDVYVQARALANSLIDASTAYPSPTDATPEFAKMYTALDNSEERLTLYLGTIKRELGIDY